MKSLINGMLEAIGPQTVRTYLVGVSEGQLIQDTQGSIEANFLLVLDHQRRVGRRGILVKLGEKINRAISLDLGSK